MISEANLDAIQTFERNNMARLLKDSIVSGVCDSEDVPGALGQRVSYLTRCV
jgi:hypothetical protein